MNSIIFRKEAETDLHLIRAYYEEVAPQALESIFADIYRSIDQLRHFPNSGMRVTRRDYRRIVTIKYHFKIAYIPQKERVEILGIFRY